jgi:hypothetical protein
VAAKFVDREQVIVIVRVGDDLQDERRVSDAAQGHGGEEGAVEAVADPLAQHTQRTAVEVVRAVGNGVEKSLDFYRTVQAVEQIEFGGGEFGFEGAQCVVHENSNHFILNSTSVTFPASTSIQRSTQTLRHKNWMR